MLFWRVAITQDLYVGIMHIIFAFFFLTGLVSTLGESLFTNKWWAQSQNRAVW